MATDMLVKDQAFSCSMAQGIIPPGQKKYVSVFFHPKTLDNRAVDYFSIIPSGGASQTLLQAVGFSTGTGSLRAPCFWGREQPVLDSEELYACP